VVVEVFRHPLLHQNHLVVVEEEVEEEEVPLRLLGQMEEVSGLSFLAPN
jgi:hypothetical protein